SIPSRTNNGAIRSDGVNAVSATRSRRRGVRRSRRSRVAGKAIGSQGRGALASPVPHSPFDLYVRFSRIQLTDGLRVMGTLPSGPWLRALRVSDGAHELVQALVVDPGGGPPVRLAGTQVTAPLLDKKSLEPPLDITVQRAELVASIAGAEVVPPSPKEQIEPF